MGCCCSKKKENTEGVDEESKKGSSSRPPSIPFENESTRGGGGGGYEPQYMTPPESGSIMSKSAVASTRRDYVPMYLFQTKQAPEISIQEGDMFRVVMEEGEWYLVVRGASDPIRKVTGYIPKKYVVPKGSLEADFNWYHGEMTKEQAEKVLKTKTMDAFLVRKDPNVQTAPPLITRDDRGMVDSKTVRRHARYIISKHKNGAAEVIHTPVYDWNVDGTVCYTTNEDQIGIGGVLQLQNEVDLTIDRRVWKCPPREPNFTVQPLSDRARASWLEIPLSELDVDKGAILGSGHFGSVKKGMWKKPGGPPIPVAVKALKDGGNYDKRAIFLQEAFVMQGLSHPNLIKLYGVSYVQESCLVIIEWVKDGALHKYLKKRKSAGQLLPESVSIDLCTQICNGMSYMEERSIVHRDLAARNVLVSEEQPGSKPILAAKVADFGLAKEIDPEKQKEGGKAKPMEKIPTKWTAPETLLKSEFSTASDVWSFAIVIHEIFSHGLEPYGVLSNPAVRDRVLKQKQILPRHPSVPEPIYELMKKCFEFEAKKRPTFKELVKLLGACQR